MQEEMHELFVSAVKELAILSTIFLCVLCTLYFIEFMILLYCFIVEYFMPFNV